MKRIIEIISRKAHEIAKNRLFTECIKNESLSPEERLAFVPMALDFIMGFRNFNKYYVKYSNPQNQLEEAITRHTEEDETHSGLLLKDWVALGLDKTLGWKPGDLYWWLTCDHTLLSRRANFELISLVYHHPNPLLRFAIIESIETAGNVFFNRTVPIAKILASKSMKCFVRFGDALMHSLGVALRNSFENEEDFIILAGVPERLHPNLEADFEADQAIAELELQPVTPQDFEVIRKIIALTKEQESRRAALGWRVIQERRYARFADNWNINSILNSLHELKTG